LAAEGIDLLFTGGAIKEIARTADKVNSQTENIGARRLHTIMTTLLEDTMFNAPELKARKVKVTQRTVRSALKDIIADEDLAKYIL